MDEPVKGKGFKLEPPVGTIMAELSGVNYLVSPELVTTEFLRKSLDLVHLLDSKQKDYGSGNITAFGEMGLLVRMSDKFERLKNLLVDSYGNFNKQTVAVQNESVEDTIKDIAGYAIIWLVWRDGKWPR